MLTITCIGCLWASLVIPTQSKDKWQIDAYSGIPANEITFTSEGMKVSVKSSANPMIYPLPRKSKILSFRVTGIFHGLPQFSDPTRQGDKGYDDYPLRIGFVVPGGKTLSGIKKLFAPEWVKKLYSQVPEGQGLDYVQFFNIAQDGGQVGRSRVHPGSELIHEHVIDRVGSPGPFRFEHKLKKPLEAVAVWLSVDGDDSKSQYSILIQDIAYDSE